MSIFNYLIDQTASESNIYVFLLSSDFYLLKQRPTSFINELASLVVNLTTNSVLHYLCQLEQWSRTQHIKEGLLNTYKTTS